MKVKAYWHVSDLDSAKILPGNISANCWPADVAVTVSGEGPTGTISLSSSRNANQRQACRTWVRFVNGFACFVLNAKEVGKWAVRQLPLVLEVNESVHGF